MMYVISSRDGQLLRPRHSQAGEPDDWARTFVRMSAPGRAVWISPRRAFFGSGIQPTAADWIVLAPQPKAHTEAVGRFFTATRPV